MAQLKMADNDYILIRTDIGKLVLGEVHLPPGVEMKYAGVGVVLAVGCDAVTEALEGDTVSFDADPCFYIEPGVVAVRETAIIQVAKGPEDSSVVSFSDENRLKVFGQIEVERQYQDTKWGGPENDDKQTEADWVKYIAEYSAGTGRAMRYDFRGRMLKTAAIAVAAIESIDRKAELDPGASEADRLRAEDEYSRT